MSMQALVLESERNLVVKQVEQPANGPSLEGAMPETSGGKMLPFHRTNAQGNPVFWLVNDTSQPSP